MFNEVADITSLPKQSRFSLKSKKVVVITGIAVAAAAVLAYTQKNSIPENVVEDLLDTTSN